MTPLNRRWRSLKNDAGKLLFLAALLAFTYNTFSPRGLPLIPAPVNKVEVPDSLLFQAPPQQDGRGSADSNTTPMSADVRVIAPLHERALRNPDSVKAAAEAHRSESGFRIISLAQFKRLRSEKRGILFDARSEEDFLKSRIPGARNIPGQDAPAHFEDVAELPRDTLIVVYCNNPDCHLGRVLIEFLTALEFKNILLFDDGWDGWIAAKEPVDSTRVKK